jgi:hypothetical protein
VKLTLHRIRAASARRCGKRTGRRLRDLDRPIRQDISAASFQQPRLDPQAVVRVLDRIPLSRRRRIFVVVWRDLTGWASSSAIMYLCRWRTATECSECFLDHLYRRPSCSELPIRGRPGMNPSQHGSGQQSWRKETRPAPRAQIYFAQVGSRFYQSVAAMSVATAISH